MPDTCWLKPFLKNSGSTVTERDLSPALPSRSFPVFLRTALRTLMRKSRTVPAAFLSRLHERTFEDLWQLDPGRERDVFLAYVGEVLIGYGCCTSVLIYFSIVSAFSYRFLLSSSCQSPKSWSRFSVQRARWTSDSGRLEDLCDTV